MINGNLPIAKRANFRIPEAIFENNLATAEPLTPEELWCPGFQQGINLESQTGELGLKAQSERVFNIFNY